MLSQQSDAGRVTAFPLETNDCTVVALAHAACISYEKAHEFARQAGRKSRRGMKRDDIRTMLRNLDISGKATTREIRIAQPTRPSTYLMSRGAVCYRRPRREGISVASFIRTLPKKGRFYLGCTTHAFAYVDGVVMDNLERPKSRATMYLAYEVIPAGIKVESKSAPTPVITQEQINELWERMNKLEGKQY